MLHFILALALLGAAPPQPESTTPPNPAPHLALSAGLLAASGLLALSKSSLLGGPPQCSLTAAGLCDPAGLTVLDRWSLGRANGTWRRISDIGEIIGIAAPAAALLSVAIVAPTDETDLAPPWDLLIWSETMAISAFIDQSLKLTLRRPRPIWYSQTARGAEAQVSMPSGHSLATATGTAALATLFWQRYPASPWRWAILSAGIVVSGLTGWGRIEAGKHFASDVLAGWTLGATLGFVHPYLLRHNLTVGMEALPDGNGATARVVTLKGAI